MLQCRTNDSRLSMRWSVAGETIIVRKRRGSRSEHVAVGRMWLNTSAEGQFDLLINSTQQNDADKYRCSVFGESATADLTLIGK